MLDQDLCVLLTIIYALDKQLDLVKHGAYRIRTISEGDSIVSAQFPVAVQLYTLRDLIATDYTGTLRAVAEMGYGAVELVMLGSYSAQELRTKLDTLSLKPVGMHILLERLETELDTVIADIKTLGVPYVVCPYLVAERRTSADDYRRVADSLNRIGAKCKEHGLGFCYHNHDFEFQAFDGKTGFEILMEHTDATLVHFELDVYWAALAGYNPAALIHRLEGRLPLVHLKDMADDPTRTFAEVGHGTLDFPAILAAGDEVGVVGYIVEQDRCARPPLESVKMSLDYLRSIGRE